MNKDLTVKPERPYLLSRTGKAEKALRRAKIAMEYATARFEACLLAEASLAFVHEAREQTETLPLERSLIEEELCGSMDFATTLKFSRLCSIPMLDGTYWKLAPRRPAVQNLITAS